MGKVYTIYLTTECNFQCTYCYEEYTKCLILDKEMLKDILDFIIDLESFKFFLLLYKYLILLHYLLI